MGSRGPLPTPTQILLMRGSRSVGARRSEPRPEIGRPPKPKWLEGEAKRVWNHIAPRLAAIGVLAKIDGNALARYCWLLSLWLKEREFLDKHGTTYPVKREGGTLFKLFPSVKVLDSVSQQLNRLEMAFGLHPAARSRIVAEIAEGRGRDDPAMEYWNRIRERG